MEKPIKHLKVHKLPFTHCVVMPAGQQFLTRHCWAMFNIMSMFYVATVVRPAWSACTAAGNVCRFRHNVT